MSAPRSSTGWYMQVRIELSTHTSAPASCATCRAGMEDRQARYGLCGRPWPRKEGCGLRTSCRCWGPCNKGCGCSSRQAGQGWNARTSWQHGLRKAAAARLAGSRQPLLCHAGRYTLYPSFYIRAGCLAGGPDGAALNACHGHRLAPPTSSGRQARGVMTPAGVAQPPSPHPAPQA